MSAYFTVHYCAPGITEEKAHALIEARDRGVDVRIVLDLSEDIFRNGVNSGLELTHFIDIKLTHPLG